jgi:hypothetical protein
MKIERRLTYLARESGVLREMLAVVCEDGDQAYDLEGLPDPDVIHEQDRAALETVGEHLDDAHELMPTGVEWRSGVIDLTCQGFIFPEMATMEGVQPFVEEGQMVYTEEGPEIILGPGMELVDALIPIDVGWAVRVVLRELRDLRLRVKQAKVLLQLCDQFYDALLVGQTSQRVPDGLGQS